MALTFGILGSLLLMAYKGTPVNRILVPALVGTIDPDNALAHDNDTTIGRLLMCKASFSKTRIPEPDYMKRGQSAPLTYIYSMVQENLYDRMEVAERMEENVLKLLREDKKAPLIGALISIIKDDANIYGENKAIFEECMESTYEEIISPGRVVLPIFLTGLLIYVVRVNDNKSGLDTYNLIKTPGYFEQFDSYMVTYTNNCIEGLTVAPDNCSVYLEKVKNKFGWVTTIIYGLDAHPLYDIYVPGTVHYRKPKIGINGGYDTEIIDGVDIESLLKVSKNFMITGTGGNGKICLNSI